jgi:phosphatidylglycerophosphate synthase
MTDPVLRGQARYAWRDAFLAPGLISLIRLPLALAFPFAARSPFGAVVILAAAGVSDVLDGWVARRFHQQTPTGAFLDGAMDKLFAVAVLATLIVASSLTVGEALLLSTREIGEAVLLAGSLVAQPHASPSARSANALGKLATVLQFVTVVVVVVGGGPRLALVIATGLCGALAATSYGVREFG